MEEFKRRSGTKEKFENVEIQRGVIDRYKRMNEILPEENIIYLDGELDEETVTKCILDILWPVLNKL